MAINLTKGAARAQIAAGDVASLTASGALVQDPRRQRPRYFDGRFLAARAAHAVIKRGLRVPKWVRGAWGGGRFFLEILVAAQAAPETLRRAVLRRQWLRFFGVQVAFGVAIANFALRRETAYPRIDRGGYVRMHR